MLIDATHPEETRVAVVSGNRLEEYDFETLNRKQLKGNIYLAKITRVEPSLQAAFVDFGGNRHGFLPFPEIHPDYYRIPIADRQALIEEERKLAREQAEKEEAEEEAKFKELGHTAESDHDEIFVDSGNMEIVDISEVTAESDTDESETVQAKPALFIQETLFDTKKDYAQPEADEEDKDEESSDNESCDNGLFANEVEVEISDAAKDHDHDSDEGAETPRHHFSKLKKYKIQEVIKRNQIMLIQISKEERGNKGAAVTSYISLPGRYCVLMPNSPRGGGVSRKVSNIKDRQRLKRILKSANIPEGMSVILRTAAISRTEAEIKRDLEYLLRLWNQIRELTLKSTAPSMIYEEGNLIKRSIRDLYKHDIEEVHIAGERAYGTAKEFTNTLAPGGVEKVHLYQDEFIPLFSRYQVEKQIDEIHNTTVQLRSGGYIVINPTEALVAIDVNSGRATKGHHIEETALKTNLEAAEEIARQLRLRDQGGLVVIDFIDMEEQRNNRTVERKLKESMQTDRARIQMGRMSPFGLLELSRQRLNPSIVETNFETCKHCEGRGVVRTVETTGVIVLRAIEEEGMRQRAAEIHVNLPTEIAIYLFNHKREMLKNIEEKYEIKAYLHADDKLLKPNFEITIVQSAKPEKAKKRTAIQSVDMSDFVAEEAPAIVENIVIQEDERSESNSVEILENDEDKGGKFNNANNKARRRGSRGGRNRGKSRNGKFNDNNSNPNNSNANNRNPNNRNFNNNRQNNPNRGDNQQPRPSNEAPQNSGGGSDESGDKRKGWWRRILSD